MKVIPIDSLQPGQEVARPLLDERGQILLNKGVQLKEHYIKALVDKGYKNLYVREPEAGDVEPEEDLSPAVRAKALQTLHDSYERIKNEVSLLRRQSADDFKRALSQNKNRVLLGLQSSLSNFEDVVSQIIDEVLTRSTLAGLTSIKSMNSFLYDHSIDVCVVALMVGQSIGLSHARMRQLAIGCLLHDIGLLFLQDENISAEGRIRQHTELGYDLLRRMDDPDILAPHVAYEHHEHQDGTGLPRGLKGSNTINRDRSAGTAVPVLIGEICALANTYDNLMTGSGDEQPMSPDKAVSKITDMAGTVLNQEVVAAFRRVVPVYPRGTQVLFRGAPFNNFLGVVSAINPTSLDRPVVLLVRDSDRKRMEPKEVDMRQYPDIIMRVVGV